METLTTGINKSIIVHADDLGMSKEVTDAILFGMQQGKIDETSLLMNFGSETEYAISEAKKLNLLPKIGIHINLTEGVPLTEDIKKISSFCTNGHFNRRFTKSFLKNFFFSKEEKKAVKEEIEAQLNLYCSYFPNGLMSLDSHHHVHTKLSVWSTCHELFQKWNIKRVRLSKNYPFTKNVLKRFYKRIINNKIRRLFITADFFTSAFDFVNFPGDINGKYEIMCHPRIKDFFNPKDPYQQVYSNGAQQK